MIYILFCYAYFSNLIPIESYYVDKASESVANPIYRRLIRGDLTRIFQWKSPAYDFLIQRRSGKYSSPLMYYDPKWADWNKNSLIANMWDSSYLRPGETFSISNIRNPIMTPDEDDVFLDTFKRIKVEEDIPMLDTDYLTIKEDGTMVFKVPGLS